MNLTIRMVLAALTVACLAGPPAVANEELAQKEALKCKVCHQKKGSALLSDKGKFYEYHRSLDGYDRLLKKFKKCTLCHANEPANQELTHTGMELKTRDVTMDHLIPPAPAKEADEKTDKTKN